MSRAQAYAHFRRLRAAWPDAVAEHRDMPVADPFLTGGDQTLLRDGRIGEICYILHRGAPARGVLLHVKRHYPAGCFRLPTGGIQPGEDVTAALRREVFEETGIRVARRGAEPDAARIGRFLGMITYAFRHRQRGRTYAFATFAFTVQAPVGVAPEPQDETERIAAWRWQPPHRLPETARALDGLRARHPDWADWGRFRAAVHDFAWRRWLQAGGPGPRA